MKKLLMLALACMIVGTGALRAAETLGIGDAAPKLEVKEFIKGEAVKEFKAGQVYVVEFWATWCGPCRATIPHLTKLQKQYGDKVIFIGVSVWERDPSLIPGFLKSMGDKMDYRVAVDKVAKDEEASDGFMAKNWMTAAEQDGIPAAFIVNGDGKIAWIGHPGEIDKTLEQVVAGNFDVAKAAVNYKKAKVAKAKLRQLGVALNKANNEGPAAVIKLLDEAIKETPELEKTVGVLKFTKMLEEKDANQDEVMKYGQRLVDEVCKDDANQLNGIAWPIIDPERKDKASKAQITFALKAAQQAVDVSKGKEHAILDTLACAHFANGDKDKAMEYLKKAMALSPDDPEYKERMKQFEKGEK